MCYAPAKRSATLITRAQERIREGKVEEASRLLDAAKVQVKEVLNVQWQGRRVGDLYQDAVLALQVAKKGQPKALKVNDL